MVEQTPVNREQHPPVNGLPLREGENPQVMILRNRLEAVFPFYTQRVLTTDPARVPSDFDRETLRRECFNESRSVGQFLKNYDISLQLASSDGRDATGRGGSAGPPPTYLLDVENNIIVDVTICQFLVGYNHVFVGTRQDLLRVLREETGPGKPYQIDKQAAGSDNYRAFFQAYWGYSSNLYET